MHKCDLPKMNSFCTSTVLFITFLIVNNNYNILLIIYNYRIAGNFDVFDAFLPDRQNLTRQFFKAIQCLLKDSDHLSKYFPSNI